MVSNIDPTYPIAGIDQPSQGFRDNFNNAKIEIEALQAGQVARLESAANLSDVVDPQASIDNLTNIGSVTTTVDVLVFRDHGANAQMWSIEEDSASATQALTFDYSGTERLRITPTGKIDPTGINDSSGNEVVLFDETGSAINEITITNASISNGPTISSTGDDVNIDLNLVPKGIGNIVLDGLSWPINDGAFGQVLATDGSGNLGFLTPVFSGLNNVVEDLTPQLGGQLDVNTFGLGDGTNLLLGFVEDASAVNYVEIENAESGSGPTIRSVGADTNIDLNISAKGTGIVNLGSGGVKLNAPLDTNGNAITGATIITLSIIAESGTIDVTSHKIVNIADPTSDQDVASKLYVDSTISAEIISAAAISSVADDTSPQLGGDLDVNGNNITMPGTETVDGRDLSVDGAKLDLIEASATGDQTASDIRILGFFDATNDGTGSGLDADLLDGQHASAFATAAQGSTADSALQDVADDTTPQLGGQLDVNTFGLGDGANLLLGFVEDESAVNYVEIENQATGSGPIIRSVGADTNVDLNIETQGTGIIVLDGLSWPTSDGTLGQVLTTDGSGNLSFATVGAGSLSNMVEDTSPQLGGTLDVNGFNITMPGAETVDGRDLSVDGDKLDLIDANANNYSHPNHTGDVTSTGDGATVIADDAVTYAKIQNVVADERLLGNVSGAGAVVAELDQATVITFLGIETGATADQTAADIRGLGFFDITNDGAASGLDADLLDGSHASAFATAAQGSLADSGLQDVVDDTTPQLGGSLDVNGNSIVSVSAGDIAITPDTTGTIILDGLNWPQADGTIGQALTTDGGGNLSFTTVAGGGLSNVVEDTTPQLGGNLDANLFDIVEDGNVILSFATGGETAVNNIEVVHSETGSGPIIRSVGSDTNVDLNVESKGTGAVRVGVPELTGTTPVISATGTDTNIDLKIEPKGTGTVQIGIPETIGTTPIISAIGTDTNIDLQIDPKGTGALILDGLSWPTADGTIGQALTTDGAGNLSFTTVGAGSLDNVVEDTTPQLGGDLDVNGQSIVSVSDGDIAITPDGTGSVILDGLSWPQTDGTDGQVLETDGAGNLSFVTTVSGVGLENIVEDTTPQLGGMLDVNTFGIGDGTNLLLDFVEDASAVNYIEIENEASGNGPIIRSAGTDTDIDFNIESKGIGIVRVGAPELTGTTPVIRASGTDTNIDLNLEPKGTGTVSVGIPESTGTTPVISATGADTNIDLRIEPKGTGTIQIGFSDSVGTIPTITATGADTNIDLKFSPKGSGSVDVDTSQIINVTDPTSAQDAATKNYVDTQSFAVTSDNNTYTKAQRGAPVAIASSATITPDFDAGNNFDVDTIDENFTLANPTNMTNAAGQSGAIVIVQDGTGSRLLSAVGGFWKFPGGTLPVLSTAIGSVDTITYYVRSSTFIVANVVLDAQ